MQDELVDASAADRLGEGRGGVGIKGKIGV